jgi:ankyrin repeat protein
MKTHVGMKLAYISLLFSVVLGLTAWAVMATDQGYGEKSTVTKADQGRGYKENFYVKYENNFYVEDGNKYCAVHDMQLQEDTVPIIYGLILFTDEHLEASKNFPNARKYTLGGCVTTPESPETEEVLYCPSCREAEDKWIEAGRTAQKKLLLHRIEKSSDINERDNDGLSLLDHASWSGYPDIVRMIINKGSNVNPKDEFKSTPLHLAAVEDHVEVVKILIEAGADVKARDEYGRTPLHEAAWFASKATVSLLIESGADINAEDNYGNTPLRLARPRNLSNRDVAPYLEQLGAVYDPAFIRRIEQASDINAKNERGETLLHKAVEEGYYNAVKKLINKGANVNARDNHGQTPLHFFVWGRHPDTLKLLVDAGADVNAKDNSGETPLHEMSAWTGDTGSDRLVRLLIEAGADVNARNEYQATPLHKAALPPNDEVIKVLIDAGADVNARNELGQTALEVVVPWYPEVAKLLIDAGADVNLRSRNSDHLIFEAIRANDANLVKLFIDAGAVLNEKNSRGETPLGYTKKRKEKWLDILKIIQNHSERGGAD